ncbi:uncharacterized protein LOC135397121 [Ornithodoros turicata]|uniref:Putative secreted protein n=1 Tax=Ornithodoros turicata TaxID=34597 RepID=A0A2R5LGD2_9ACAR
MQSAKLITRVLTSGVRSAATTAATKGSKGPTRRLTYPYTYAQKIANFPYRFHYENMWLVRYLIPALALTYLFYIIPVNRAVNSPANYAAYEEAMRKQAEEDAAHHHH